MARTASRSVGTAAASDTEALAASMRLSVTRLARILRHQDGGDLTPSTTSALATINRHGPLTLGDLAAREHVSAPTITRIVEKLQQQGLVARTTSATDGRVTHATVTDKGRRLVVAARSRRTEWLVDHLGRLSAAELAALAAAAPVLEHLIATADDGAER